MEPDRTGIRMKYLDDNYGPDLSTHEGIFPGYTRDYLDDNCDYMVNGNRTGNWAAGWPAGTATQRSWYWLILSTFWEPAG